MIETINIGPFHYGTDSKKTTAVYEFICSELSDIELLPTYATEEHPYCNTAPHPSSTCICTANNTLSVYMLGADDVWHNITSGSAGDLENGEEKEY